MQRDHTLSSVRFYYDGLHAVEQNNWTTSESARKLFVFGPQIDELLLYVDINASPDAYYYAHTDRLGSVQLLVDGNGEIEESYRYREFGETTIVDGSFAKLTTTVNSPVGNPHRYTGRREDIQVGTYEDDWYDLRSRVLRVGVGRFIQTDPITFIDGASPYPYVRNNPTNWHDPLGTSGLEIALAGGGAIAGGIGLGEAAAAAGAALVSIAASPIVVGAVAGAAIGTAIGAGISAAAGGSDTSVMEGHFAAAGTGTAITADQLADNIGKSGLFPFLAAAAAADAADEAGDPPAAESKEHTEEQKEVVELFKWYVNRGGISEKDWEALKELAEDAGLPVRGPEEHTDRPSNVSQGPHGHLPGVKGHLPIGP